MPESGEVDPIPAVLERFGASARAAAQRPESFWACQRRSIQARLPGRSTARRGWLWWASSAAAVLLSAVLFDSPRAPRVPAVKVDSDHELLADIERTVRRELPPALEPAALLAGELERTLAGARPPAEGGTRR